MSLCQSPPVTTQTSDQDMDDIEWTLLRGPAPSNRLGLESAPDLLGGPIRQSSRTAAPAGSRRRSPADPARNSPVSPPATASRPAKQVWQTRDHEHAGARDDSSMAIRRPQAASESWTKFSPQDDRNESGRRPWRLPSTIRYRKKSSLSRNSPGAVGNAAECTDAIDGRFSRVATIAVSAEECYRSWWDRSAGFRPIPNGPPTRTCLPLNGLCNRFNCPLPSSRMLKKSASFVLASLRGSTYRRAYASPLRLAAALLDCLFEHPGDPFCAHHSCKTQRSSLHVG